MKRFALMFAVSIATLGATVVAMHREAAADHPCHKVSARIADALVAEDCPSPFGLCTAGTTPEAALGEIDGEICLAR